MENGRTTACRTLTLLFVFVIASFTVFGQGDGSSEDAVRYYTGLRVGDTVDVGADDTTMFRVIAFSSSNACLSCTVSLESIRQLLSMHGSVSIWSDAIQRAGTSVRHTRMLRRGLEAFVYEAHIEFDPRGEKVVSSRCELAGSIDAGRGY